MRETIFEKLKSKVSFAAEIRRLDELIHDKHGIKVEIPKTLIAMSDDDYDVSFYSLEYFFDQVKFKSWKSRGTCINCDDMRETLLLDEILENDDPTDKETITFCEYVANLVSMYDKTNLKESIHIKATSVITAIKDNLRSLLDLLNCEMKVFEDQECVLIVEKNAAVTAVAETTDKELSFRIIQYNHIALKGQLTRKKEILQMLGNQIEPERKNLTSVNKQLADNIFFLLNNLDVRHNNRSKKDKNFKEYTAQMTKKRLEKWYDELYQMILLAMLELEQMKRNKRIDELKSHY